MAAATVRDATAADAGELGRIHAESWRLAYADLLPAEVLEELRPETLAARWSAVLEHGEDVVLVAEEGAAMVGFCMASHAVDEDLVDAEGNLPADADHVMTVGTLVVEARWGRRGHAGRLLATAAQRFAADAARGVSWVPEADTAALAFFERAGWHSDGLVRTLDAAGTPVREVRMTGSTDLQLTD